MHTLQSVFDVVAKHAMSMPQPAVGANRLGHRQCYYRAPNGTRCFVGALIPDDAYHPSFEGQGAGVPCVMKAAGIPAGLGWAITTLQSIHDDHDQMYWAGHLRRFADLHDLTIPKELT